MSRGLRLIPLGLSLLVLAACGGGSAGSSTTTDAAAKLVTPGLTPPKGCFLTVFLLEDVTGKQRLRLQRQLLANPLITEVSYVPRGLELRRFAKRHPLIARGMLFNPFSDRFEVVLRTHDAMFPVIAAFAKHGGPTLNVRPSTACGQPS